MDFNATNWLERNYKWVTVIIIFLLSIITAASYFIMNDKSDTFIISMIYALTLFVAGIFINYMANKIEDKIQDRIEIFCNLKRIESCLKHTKETEGFDRRVLGRIDWFQIFTGRLTRTQDDEQKPYIIERGVKFISDELIIEDMFREKHTFLLECIRNIIKKYTDEHEITLKTQVVYIDSISNFKPDIWCKVNLTDYKKHGRKMVNYLYGELVKIRDDIDDLEVLGLKVMDLYDCYLAKTRRNIMQIELLYGRKLQYRILNQSEMQNNFDFILKRLTDIEDFIVCRIDEHDDKIELYVREIDEISRNITDIQDQIYELSRKEDDDTL